MKMATFTLSEEVSAAAGNVLARRVQSIDYDLGDCHNTETKAELLLERGLLIQALGELWVGAAEA